MIETIVAFIMIATLFCFIGYHASDYSNEIPSLVAATILISGIVGICLSRVVVCPVSRPLVVTKIEKYQDIDTLVTLYAKNKTMPFIENFSCVRSVNLGYEIGDTLWMK